MLGGPLMTSDPANGYRQTLIGVTSWGHGCARPNKPGVYSEVSYNRKWLDKHIGTAQTCSKTTPTTTTVTGIIYIIAI